MNPVPYDEYDERQRKEAESQIRRMTARLENERIRAQTGPRVDAWKAEKNRAAWKDTQDHPASEGLGTPRSPLHRTGDHADARPATAKLVSSPAPVPLGRSVPPEWRSIQLHRRNPGEWKVWLAWGACSVPWLLLLWKALR